MTWFEDDLIELQNSPKVNLKIHITANKVTKEEISTPLPIQSADEEDQEKELGSITRPNPSRRNSLRNAIELGRPDIDILVRQIAQHDTPRDGRVLVVASGPSTLLSNTRTAVKACMSSQSASIHMHLEEFNW